MRLVDLHKGLRQIYFHFESWRQQEHLGWSFLVGVDENWKGLQDEEEALQYKLSTCR